LYGIVPPFLGFRDGFNSYTARGCVFGWKNVTDVINKKKKKVTVTFPAGWLSPVGGSKPHGQLNKMPPSLTVFRARRFRDMAGGGGEEG